MPLDRYNSLLNKPVSVVRWLFVILLIAAIVILTVLHQRQLDEEMTFFVERTKSLLIEELENKHQIGQAINLSLSSDSRIKQAMAYEDRSAAIYELESLLENYSRAKRFSDIEFHLITADGRSFVKSFDFLTFNQDLSSHKVISQALESKSIATGIDVGGPSKHLRIIDVLPIYALSDATEIVGYTANSQSFKSTLESFRKYHWLFAVFRPVALKGSANQNFLVSSKSLYPDTEINQLSFSQEELLATDVHFKNGLFIYTHNLYNKDGAIRGVLAVARPDAEIISHSWSYTWNYIFLFMFVFLLLWGLSFAVFTMIRKDILAPIEEFDQSIENIINNKAFDQKVELEGNNEIVKMSQKFNQLLELISQSVYSLQHLQNGIEKTLIVSRTDPFGTITYVNDNFCKISGYSSEELMGKSHNIVRHPDVPSEIYQDLWRTIQSKQIWTGQIQNRNKKGQSYHVISYILPILNKSGHLVEYMSIREDITERIRLQSSLEVALADSENKKQIAEKSNQAKSEFLSSMSHELRTPLNSIIGFAQLLEMSELTDSQKEQLNHIAKSGQHLLQLINDLLELSRIESGNMSLSIEQVELKRVIDETLPMMLPAASKNNISLYLDKDSNFHYCVTADHLRLKQVLMNFLSNAIKYNSVNGSVKIHSHLTSSGSEADQLDQIRICITDTGPGIPKAKQNLIFEPFQRLGHENSKIEGTGIGLTITKDLIEAMGGQVGFDSEEHQGTTFWFELPIIAHDSMNSVQTLADNRSEEGLVSHEDITDSKKISVLYIEDNPANMKLMVTLVETINHCELVISPTAEDGIQKAKAIVPDIIFVDINLPGMNGDEALPILKSIPELQAKGTKFYALTANAMKDDIKQGQKVGFDAYLTKPINVKEIIDRIKATTQPEA